MLFQLSAATAVAFASAALAAPKNPGQCTSSTFPTQVRLAYAGDHGMAVSWNTKQQLTNPTVYFGKDQSLNRVAQSDVSTTYPSSSTYNNHVALTGLEPDTAYFYKPNCGNVTYTFTTARRPGQGTEFSFAMVGDMGTFGPDGLSTTVGKGAANPLKPGDLTTIQSLAARQGSYDFIWHGMRTAAICDVFIS